VPPARLRETTVLPITFVTFIKLAIFQAPFLNFSPGSAVWNQTAGEGGHSVSQTAFTFPLPPPCVTSLPHYSIPCPQRLAQIYLTDLRLIDNQTPSLSNCAGGRLSRLRPKVGVGFSDSDEFLSMEGCMRGAFSDASDRLLANDARGYHTLFSNPMIHASLTTRS